MFDFCCCFGSDSVNLYILYQKIVKDDGRDGFDMETEVS